MNFERSIELSVERLNDLYDEELGDREIVLRELPDGKLMRLSIIPEDGGWRSDLCQAGTEDELQAFILGLEKAAFNTIERKSE